MSDPFPPALLDCAYRVRTSLMHAVLDILGDPWNLLILREVLPGGQRFDVLIECLGVSRPALSKRLESLLQAGCLFKTPYCTSPLRYQYEATPMGRGVQVILQLLQQWNERWQRGAIPANVVCQQCAAPLIIKVQCSHCDRVLDARQVKPLAYQPLPAGIPPMPAYRRTRHQVASKEREAPPLAISAEAWIQDRWSALILGGMMMGLQRYGDFFSVLSIAPNILSGRLEVLSQAQLIARCEDGRYRLTERGYALYPAIMAMRGWGEQWLNKDGQGEMGWGLLHQPCGEWLKLKYVCACCNLGSY